MADEPAPAPPAPFPHLGEPVAAFLPWFGEPTSARTVHDYVVLVFEGEAFKLGLLCLNERTLAIHCRYLAEAPEWSVMLHDARLFLPRSFLRRWLQRLPPPVPAERGWTIALRSVPDYALRALAEL
ncbi:MAG TPA: hypothetical protein VFA70_03275 [Dehalococcoidia bacterium]|nr:hypothetical protein [Dehalococcoidia bacterium]